jgi:hypothetical protein
MLGLASILLCSGLLKLVRKRAFNEDRKDQWDSDTNFKFRPRLVQSLSSKKSCSPLVSRLELVFYF